LGSGCDRISFQVGGSEKVLENEKFNKMSHKKFRKLIENQVREERTSGKLENQNHHKLKAD
jgi:hypothetical protein